MSSGSIPVRALALDNRSAAETIYPEGMAPGGRPVRDRRPSRDAWNRAHPENTASFLPERQGFRVVGRRAGSAG